MSDEYDEPSRRGTFALYLAGAVIGTILVLSAFKAAFDIDVVGGLVDLTNLVPERIERDKNVIEETVEYISDLLDRRFR